MRRIDDLFDTPDLFEAIAGEPDLSSRDDRAAPPLAISLAQTIIVSGGANDTLTGSAGVMAYFGGDGADRISFGGDGSNGTLAVGGAGDDRLTGAPGSFLVGGAGADVMTLTSGGAAWGGEGPVLLSAFYLDTGVARASGGAAIPATPPEDVYFYLNQHVDDGVRDVITGSAFSDDLAIGRLDAVDGGGGLDRAFAVFDAFTRGVSIDFTGKDTSATLASALSATIVSVEEFYVTGTRFNDTFVSNGDVAFLLGRDGDDVVTVVAGEAVQADGGRGADRLTGSTQRDVLAGGSGEDILGGGVGNDVLIGGILGDSEALHDDGVLDRINGGDGEDRIYAGVGDIVDGGTGDDTISVSLGSRDRGVVLDFSGGYERALEAARLITLTSTERFTISGTDFDDQCVGTTGSDTFDGGRGDDRLSGGAGGLDILDGGDGDDVLGFVGNTGEDYAYGGNGEDTVVVGGRRADYTITTQNGQIFITGAGQTVVTNECELVRFSDQTVRIADTVRFDGVVTGDDASNFIVARFDQYGDLKLYGMGGSDWLQGREYDDLLDGGSGRDIMAGLRGDDRYVVDSSLDIIIEQEDEGVDTVLSKIHWSLADVRNVENVTLTGSADLAARGNELDNTLIGNSGKNVLTGGKGNDTYVIQTVGDRVVELNGEGRDLVRSSITFSLAGQYVEDLELTGSAAINATGNSLANVLTGNAGVNVLTGGAGNDTYVVQTRGDRVVETAGEGDDHVISSVDFNMAGAYVERLTLTGTAKYGTGNSLDNTITGNASNNILSGGAGADTLIGGKGHDRYIVDNVKDRVVEKADEGSDLIVSSVTYSLAGTYVERLELSGTAGLNATGNSLDNTLAGNGGANRLEGGGGADTLIGGAGGDTYVYRALSDSTVARSDTIIELGFGDRLDLSLIDANTALAGNQAFALVDAFSGARGQATLAYDAGAKMSTLLLDLDGDRTADMRILIGGDANEARIVF